MRILDREFRNWPNVAFSSLSKVGGSKRRQAITRKQMISSSAVTLEITKTNWRFHARAAMFLRGMDEERVAEQKQPI